MTGLDKRDVIAWNRHAWASVLWAAFGVISVVACIYKTAEGDPRYLMGLLGSALALWFAARARRAWKIASDAERLRPHNDQA